MTGASTCVTRAAASVQHANNQMVTGNGDIKLFIIKRNICSLIVRPYKKCLPPNP